jgi:ribosomal protein S18 acetylase RimI-like enzyme
VDVRGFELVDGLAEHVLAMQHAAYAIEAELIGDDRIPPLHETIDDLLAVDLRWLGAYEDDRLIGAIGVGEPTNWEVDIDRLMVDPRRHRRGAGRALVAEVVRRAERRSIVVSTGRDNPPARRLYESFDFEHTGDHEVIPGLWVARYRRPPRPSAVS